MPGGPNAPKPNRQPLAEPGEVAETVGRIRPRLAARPARGSLARSGAPSYAYPDVRDDFEQPPFGQAQPGWTKAARGGFLALLLVPLTACSVAAETETSAEEHLVVHALVQVRRTETLGGDSRADALAGLIRVPDSADPAEVFSLAGLREAFPGAGQCQAGDLVARENAEIASVELVPAEAVLVLTPGGEHALAPHAFPSISDSIRGVIYTSRDQTAGSFPDAEKYEIVLRGAEGLGTTSAVHASPAVPSGASVGGIPLAELEELAQSDLDFTWMPSGSTLDLMAVRLRWDDRTYTCTFKDADGFGTLSLAEAARALGGATQSGAKGTLSLHRVRAEASAAPGDTSMVEVRFDFSVAREIGFALPGRSPGAE